MNADEDPYVYPGTRVLKNKRNIQDFDKLAEAERKVVGFRQGTLSLDIPPSVESFQHIHRHLFQDLFDWAGEFRRVTLSKDNTMFCHWSYIEKEITKRFDLIQADKRLLAADKEVFCAACAEHINELNAVHPFREGNGRTMRQFLRQLAHQNGQNFQINKLDRDEWIHASIVGWQSADYEPMEKAISSAIDWQNRTSEDDFRQKILRRSENLKRFQQDKNNDQDQSE